MTSWHPRRVLPLALIATALALPAQATEATGEWSERVQVVYDAESRTVSRVRLRVWNPEPSLNLEFTWEPAPGAAFAPSSDGTLEGTGRLVWRVRGSAAHDLRSIHSTYVGQISAGRPNGAGRLETRAGEVFEGHWKDGLLHGEGDHLDAAGNRYTGTFERGVVNGTGRQAMADGSIYRGSFRDGVRHGDGTTRMPGGAVYASTWRDGVEVGGGRPDAVADATLGGLLRAQAGGGDAGKVSVSMIVDQRMTQQSDLRYTHAVLDEHVEIYPENPGMVDYWIGQNQITQYSYGSVFGSVDWEDAPSFLEAGFETSDGSRVRVADFQMQVEHSQVYRKPFLSSIDHVGCVGYRPTFSLQNNGWGRVQDARFSFAFVSNDEPDRKTRTFETSFDGFDEAIDLDLEPLLAQAGVDTATLAAKRFSCDSPDNMQQCWQSGLDGVQLGEIADLVGKEYFLSVGVHGRLAYRWTDDGGNTYDADEEVQASITIGAMETEFMVAEGGDGWGGAPAALRYQRVDLPESAQNYVIDLPIRGNRNLAAYVHRLKVYAPTTSIHRFRVVARLEDGSERSSKPIMYFHMKPRETYYEPAEPAGCYLDPVYTPPRYGG